MYQQLSTVAVGHTESELMKEESRRERDRWQLLDEKLLLLLCVLRAVFQLYAVALGKHLQISSVKYHEAL